MYCCTCFLHNYCFFLSLNTFYALRNVSSQYVLDHFVYISKIFENKTDFGKQNGSTHFKVRGIEGSEVQMSLKYS